MAIKAYSYAKDGNRKLSANFAVKEFRCKDGSDPIFIDDELVTLLQKIRDHFGKSVTITSAYRTAAHNKAVKGATYSQHCYTARLRTSGCRAWVLKLWLPMPRPYCRIVAASGAIL